MQDVENDIKNTEPVVEEALTAAQELMAHCSPDDVEILQRKADSLSHDSEKVKTKTEQKLYTLNDTEEVVGNFYHLDKDLKTFFADASSKHQNRPDEDIECILVGISFFFSLDFSCLLKLLQPLLCV